MARTAIPATDLVVQPLYNAHVFKVASGSRLGISHMVQTETGHCTCESQRLGHRLTCKHLEAALMYERSRGMAH